jgi:Concanavalin A-like lectin/glucanases superfamily
MIRQLISYITIYFAVCVVGGLHSAHALHGPDGSFRYSDTFSGGTGTILIGSMSGNQFRGLAVEPLDPIPWIRDNPYENESFYVVYNFSGGNMGTSFDVIINTSSGIELKYDQNNNIWKQWILGGNWDGAWGTDMAWVFECLPGSSSTQQWLEVIVRDQGDPSNFVGGRINVEPLAARNQTYQQLFDPSTDMLGFWFTDSAGLGWIYDYYNLESVGKYLCPDTGTVMTRTATINSNFYVIYGWFAWLPGELGNPTAIANFEENLLMLADMIKTMRPDNDVLLQIGSIVAAEDAAMTYYCDLVKSTDLLDGIVYDFETHDYNYITAAQQFVTIRNKLGWGEQLVCVTHSTIGAYSGLRWSDIESVIDYMAPMYYITQRPDFLQSAFWWARDEWLYDPNTTTDPIIPAIIPAHKGSTLTPSPVHMLYDSLRISDKYGHPGAQVYRPYSMTAECEDMIRTAFGEFDLNFIVEDISISPSIVADGDTVTIDIVVKNIGTSDADFEVPIGLYLNSVEFDLGESPDTSAAQLAWLYEFEDTGSVATDSSQHGNDATLTDMDPGTDWVAGKHGNALEFDGVDDYAMAPFDSSMNPAGACTAEYWLWIDPSHNWTSYVFCRNSTIQSRLSNGNWPGVDFYFTGVGIKTCWATGTIARGEWHHIAGVYDGADLILYIDGAENNRVAVGSDTVRQYAQALYIGKFSSTNSYNFKGKLDELALYSYAKEPSELGYYQKLPVPSSGSSYVDPAFAKISVPSIATGDTAIASLQWNVSDTAIDPLQPLNVFAMVNPPRYFPFNNRKFLPSGCFEIYPQLVGIAEMNSDDNISSEELYLDSDGDFMGDAWEQENWGTLSRTGLDDYDTDNKTDLDEFNALTDPKLDSSYFAIASIESGSSIAIEWRGSSQRNYRILYRDDLAIAWLPIPNQQNIAGVDGEMQWTDDGSDITSPPLSSTTQRFYKLEVFLP